MEMTRSNLDTITTHRNLLTLEICSSISAVFNDMMGKCKEFSQCTQDKTSLLYKIVSLGAVQYESIESIVEKEGAVDPMIVKELKLEFERCKETIGYVKVIYQNVKNIISSQAGIEASVAFEQEITERLNEIEELDRQIMEYLDNTNLWMRVMIKDCGEFVCVDLQDV